MSASTCEICGKPSGVLRKVSFEGSLLLVCSSCLSRLGLRAVVVREEGRVVERKVVRVRDRFEGFDLVEDFGDRIRKAREARGWSEAVLAQKLRVSVDVVRRIESGKLKPSIQLARNIESVLKIKLIVPTEEGEATGELGPVTFGDIVVVRRGEE